jgi:hypothetical protein
MLATSDAMGAYEASKQELCARYPGQFVVILGRRLLAVHASLEDALQATADSFDAGRLPAGVPILISEIAEQPVLRLVTELRQGSA